MTQNSYIVYREEYDEDILNSVSVEYIFDDYKTALEWKTRLNEIEDNICNNYFRTVAKWRITEISSAKKINKGQKFQEPFYVGNARKGLVI
jgi:hypothetical protein